jgi:hypothetical protein
LLHLSISRATSLPKSSGEPPSTVPPSLANRSFFWGSSSTALTSLLSLAMVADGVCLGAPIPCQTFASYPRHGRGHGMSACPRWQLWKLSYITFLRWWKIHLAYGSLDRGVSSISPGLCCAVAGANELFSWITGASSKTSIRILPSRTCQTSSSVEACAP